MRQFSLLIGVLALCVLSCKSPTILSEAEKARILGNARQGILDAFPDLDSTVEPSLRVQTAQFSYYRLGGDYAQYSITWEISSNRVVSVWGQGNVKQLEGSKITLYQKRSATAGLEKVAERPFSIRSK